MTKENLEIFEKLNEEFLIDCNRIKYILCQSKDILMRNIEFAEDFRLENGTVFWEGHEYWSFGGHEHHSGCFDSNYLSMTDEELESIVAKKNKEYEKKMEKAAREQAKHAKTERFELFQKLKKEFEN